MKWTVRSHPGTVILLTLSPTHPPSQSRYIHSPLLSSLSSLSPICKPEDPPLSYASPQLSLRIRGTASDKWGGASCSEAVEVERWGRKGDQGTQGMIYSIKNVSHRESYNNNRKKNNEEQTNNTQWSSPTIVNILSPWHCLLFACVSVCVFVPSLFFVYFLRVEHLRRVERAKRAS